jgi:hypothetical protein
VLSEWEAGGAIGPAKDLIKMKQSKNNRATPFGTMQWNITRQSQFLVEYFVRVQKESH